MDRWLDPDQWQENTENLIAFSLALYQELSSLNVVEVGRKKDPEWLRRHLLQRVSDSTAKLPLYIELVETIEAAIAGGHARLAGRLGEVRGRIDGAIAGAVAAPETLLQSQSSNRREKAARAGRASSKLTVDDLRYAQSVVNDFCRGTGNNFSPACVRAAAKLKAERGVDITDRRLRQILDDPTV